MKKLIKIIVDIPCVLIVLIPVLLIRLFNINSRYSDFAVCLAYIPFFIGERARYYFYKLTLTSVGGGVRFKFGSWVQYRTVEIGNNVLIGYFNSLGECKIGNDVLLGGSVNILSGLNQHNFKDKSIKIIHQGGQRNKIIVGDDVYIGSGSTIGANIAKGSVIAAGSIVVNDTEEYGVYANPKAILVKKRS